jgi:hypothetical protein
MAKRNRQAVKAADWHGRQSRGPLRAGTHRRRPNLPSWPPARTRSRPNRPGSLWLGRRRRVGAPGTPRRTLRLDHWLADGRKAANPGGKIVQNKANLHQGELGVNNVLEGSYDGQTRAGARENKANLSRPPRAYAAGSAKCEAGGVKLEGPSVEPSDFRLPTLDFKHPARRLTASLRAADQGTAGGGERHRAERAKRSQFAEGGNDG